MLFWFILFPYLILNANLKIMTPKTFDEKINERWSVLNVDFWRHLLFQIMPIASLSIQVNKDIQKLSTKSHQQSQQLIRWGVYNSQFKQKTSNAFVCTYKVIRILVCQSSKTWFFALFDMFFFYNLNSWEKLLFIWIYGNYLCFQFYTIETNTYMVKRRMWKF